MNKLTLTTGQIQQRQPETRKYSAQFVQAGRIKAADGQPGPLILPPETLQAAALRGMFHNRAIFLDHASMFDYPSLDNLIGVTLSAEWNESSQAITGEIEIYETPAGAIATSLIDEIIATPASAPDVGLSMVFYPQYTEPNPEDQTITILSIRHIESIDLVFQPAANGRILQKLSRHYTGAPRPHSLDSNHQSAPYQTKEPTMPPTEEKPFTTPHLNVVQVLLRSGLPPAAQEKLGEQSYPNLEALNSAIENERAYLASLNAPTTIQLGAPPRGGQISNMKDSLDRITLAAEALIAGLRPKDVAPLSGIRELYTLLSGDYEMSGVFHPERIGLGNVNSSTMAGIVANALNKVVINEFQQYPKWWSSISQELDFTTLQQVKWITLGGIGELPTVAEGAAYTELTWDDNTETATFYKKGGYLGITLEAIDKDDTSRVAAAPRALAQAAWLTLSKSISSIFTSAAGVGPNLADGNALFYARSAGTNVGTTALSITAWNTVKTAMRKFTELNSGERLGALVSPKYILVPPDLETTALQVLASEADYTYALSNGVAAPTNVFAEGDAHNARLMSARKRVIVVDLWTDTNNWAAIADPMMYPTIGIGYRYGRQPEIFSVASPTAGLMFTNDTMPVKVRFFYATGPQDWRGMYKMNVT
jgi:hypothetical protein